MVEQLRVNWNSVIAWLREVLAWSRPAGAESLQRLVKCRRIGFEPGREPLLQESRHSWQTQQYWRRGVSVKGSQALASLQLERR